MVAVNAIAVKASIMILIFIVLIFLNGELKYPLMTVQEHEGLKNVKKN